MAENIKSRKYYRVHNGESWDRMHFVTDANSVDANDGDNMEVKVGAIKGLTTSTSVTEEGYAADAKTVSEINGSLSKVKTYVGSDGKLHFVNASGADTVLNFSNIKSKYILIYRYYRLVSSASAYFEFVEFTESSSQFITTPFNVDYENNYFRFAGAYNPDGFSIFPKMNVLFRRVGDSTFTEYAANTKIPIQDHVSQSYIMISN